MPSAATRYRAPAVQPVPPIIKHPVLCAHRIDSRLWQGAYPDEAQWTTVLSDPACPVTMLILCASELQPRGVQQMFPRVQVVRCPFDDIPSVDDDTWSRITTTARTALRQLQAGGRCLVTCAAGRNRSGLVAARIMSLRYPSRPMHEIIAQIQRLRQAPSGPALSNGAFVEALMLRPR